VANGVSVGAGNPRRLRYRVGQEPADMARANPAVGHWLDASLGGATAERGLRRAANAVPS
jgi:hypothetical protein